MKRNIFAFGFGVPDGGFDGGLGHVVSANLFEKRPDIGGGGELLPFQLGPEEIVDNVPSGFGVFGRVERSFAGGAFAPPGGAIDIGFDEDDAAMGDAVHAGFEWGDELHVNLAKSEAMEAHGWSLLDGGMISCWVQSKAKARGIHRARTARWRRDPHSADCVRNDGVCGWIGRWRR